MGGRMVACPPGITPLHKVPWKCSCPSWPLISSFKEESLNFWANSLQDFCAWCIETLPSQHHTEGSHGCPEHDQIKFGYSSTSCLYDRVPHNQLFCTQVHLSMLLNSASIAALPVAVCLWACIPTPESTVSSQGSIKGRLLKLQRKALADGKEHL